MTYARTLCLGACLGLIGVLAVPAAAAPGDKANLTGLSDVSFGTVASFLDQVSRQTICAYSASPTLGYSITGIGSGPGGSFNLASGSAQLPYEVLWNSASNQASGTSLIAGTPRSGFVSSASQKTCNSGPSSSGTLIIVLRSAALGSARAGSYAGTLQVTIAPE